MTSQELKRLEEVERKAQRALDLQAIQNTMAMHCYYHAANWHDEELDKVWAKKTPGVAFHDLIGRYEGMDAIRAFYYDGHIRRGAAQRKMMKKLYPWIEDDPRNDFIGKLVVHMLTTSFLEVAEDGQTAKGIWISPGYMSMCSGGKMRAFWHYDRYGVDFVKEDGEWKIWHLHIYRDFMTPFEKSWVDNALNPDPQNGLGSLPPDFVEPNAPDDPYPKYEAYNPFGVAQFGPRPPEPYKTFSETFS